MSRISDDRIRKQLDEAEGYLMLDLPERSLQILESRPDWLNMQFEASFLKGEALRSLKHYREALQTARNGRGTAAHRYARRSGTGMVLQTHQPAGAGDRLARTGAYVRIPTRRSCTTTWPATGAWPVTAQRPLTRSRPPWSSMPTFERSSPTSRTFNHLRGNPAFERLLGHAPLT